MKFDIIIPITENIDRFKFIGCLESCTQQKTSYPIYPLCVCCNKYLNQIEDIIEKYRITCISIDNDGICECINKGLRSSSNERIIILNPTDILNNNAIELLSNYNDEVVYYTDQESFSFCNIKICSIKRSSLNKLQFWFEQYYAPYHHDKFLLNCSFNELSIQTTEHNIFAIKPDLNGQSEQIKNILYNYNRKELGELTCVIPFKNEKSEVERTILSIFATSKNTNIVLINDCSDDDFDYSFIKSRYPFVKYIENKHPIGHGNIDLGVINSDSEYCILLDSHMRFYEQNWDIRILNLLKENQNTVFYCNTTIMRVNNGIYQNEDNSQTPIHNIGAKVNLEIDRSDRINVFQHRWSYKSKTEDSENNIHITPNVLGACYAFSKEHYWNIGGTYGLSQYGLSEAALAVKTWLMGGKVFRIQDLYVGHLYRNIFPYKCSGYSSLLNDRFLINLYINDSEFKDKCLEYNKDKSGSENSKKYFDDLWNKLEDKFNRYINHYKSKFIYDINWFQENINSKFND